MAQLHGLDDTIHNHRGTQTSSQAQEEHPAALVASERLHGRIIDNFDRAPKRCSKVKPHPTRGEVVRFDNRTVMEHWSWVAHRYHVILPLPGKLLDARDHQVGCQFRPGEKLPAFGLPSGEDLAVGPTDVNC